MVSKRMFPRGAVLAAALLSFCLALPASAQHGWLDPTFPGGGPGGKLTFDFFGGDDQALGIILDHQGRLVVGGFASPPVSEEEDKPAPPGGYERRWALTRHSADGAFDLSFGNGGWIVYAFARQAFLKPVLVDPDGRILSVGRVCDPSIASVCEFTVTRVDSNGFLDAGFGDGGVARFAFGGLYGSASSLVLDPDGRMWVGGTVRVPKPGNDYGDEDFALAAVLPDGTLDASFGNGGLVTVDMSGGGGEDVLVSLLRRRGELLAVGYAQVGMENRRAIAVARFRTQGGAPGLVNGGRALVDPGGWLYTAAATLDDRGRILVAGSLTRTAGAGFAVVRLRSNGNLDASFGNGGLSLTGFDDFYQTPVSAGPAAILVLADGTIVVPGTVLSETDMSDFAVAYLYPNGAQNPWYGTSGRVATDFDGGLDRAFGAVVEPEGRLVVAGAAMSQRSLDDMFYNFALAGYSIPPLPARAAVVVQPTAAPRAQSRATVTSP